jgi:thiamine-phosphate pyrophosphorylase
LTSLDSRPDQFLALLQRTKIYAVTDDSLGTEQLLAAVDQLLEAGVRLFQYRDKIRSDRERVEVASLLGERVHLQGGLLIVNDRVDVALAANADGAHLGQDDLPLAVGRTMLGPKRVLGASASYLPEIAPAVGAGIDYLGFGAVFPTGTKPDAEFAGLGLFEEACRCATVPVVGIGGINASRAGAVVACGAAGVAVVSALFRAADPAEAARELFRALGRDGASA